MKLVDVLLMRHRVDTARSEKTPAGTKPPVIPRPHSVDAATNPYKPGGGWGEAGKHAEKSEEARIQSESLATNESALQHDTFAPVLASPATLSAALPRWSLQNRPMVVTAKAANGDGPGQCCFTPLNRYRASPFWYASSGDRT